MVVKLVPTLDDVSVQERLVLVRVDLNVPVSDTLQVTDYTRLDCISSTLKELSKKRARTILISHFGRPKGRREDRLSLRFLANPISQLIDGREVVFASDCIGTVAKTVVNAIQPGHFALLENLRFHPGEEENEPGFVSSLACLADVYVNDAFSASHRPHASIVGVPALLPHVAGRSMQKELEVLSRVLKDAATPSMAIIGGAKISTKLGLLANLSKHVDVLAIGGGMANTLLYAKGVNVGSSICEPELLDDAKQIIAEAEKNSCEMLLPVDAATVRDRNTNEPAHILSVNEIPENGSILDVGPATMRLIANRLANCKTLLWNGPMGLFEIPPFDTSTNFLARKAAAMTDGGTLTSVAGGGDTLAALNQAGVSSSFSYISTGGGAFLEWLEGRDLPGVASLKSKAHRADKR